jgi:hypothetical protein
MFNRFSELSIPKYSTLKLCLPLKYLANLPLPHPTSRTLNLVLLSKSCLRLPELPPSFDYSLVNKASVLKSDVWLMNGSAFPDDSVVVKGVKLLRELTDF